MTEPRDIAGLSPEQRALLMLRMRRKAALEEEPAAAVIPRVPRGSPLPLSFAQQRLWFLDRWAPESPAYNVPAAVLLQGDLDVRAFVRALTAIVHRHETLRTTFPAVDGEPRQVIAPPGPLPVPLVDLTALSAAARHEEAQRLARREAGRPFDLGQGPLIRARVLRLDRREHVVLVNMHHIVSDGWSVGVLIRELSELYGAFLAGRSPALLPLPVQYADFAVWQRDRLRGEELERQLAYWRGRLGEAPPPLELPTDRPRPAVRGVQGRFLPFLFPAGLWGGIEALCQRQGITPFMAVLAGFATLLHRLTGETDMALGTPIAGRNRQEIEGLIGFFVNTLVLRTGLAGEPPFVELLARLRDEVLGAFSHQDLPFEKLVEELQPQRRLDLSPLFQVSFAVQNTPPGRLDLPGVELRMVPAETGATRVDLGFEILQFAQVQGRWEYATDLFDAATLVRMSGHLLHLLAAAVADPGRRLADLPLLSEAERHQLLVAWNDTEREYERHLTVHEMFDLQAERAPDAVAVVSPDLEQWTYAGLARHSTLIARHLRSAGVGSEEVVGLAVERSPALIAAMLGIARAGGVCLPLDLSYPAARLAGMLDDAAVRVVVGEPDLTSLPAFAGRQVVGLHNVQAEGSPRAGSLRSQAAPQQAAYIIYTSGSTGRPKGVAVPHGALAAFTAAARALYGIGPSDRVLQLASISFDASVEEIYPCLTAGGTLVLRTDEMAATLDGFLSGCASQGITVLDLPTAFWHELAASLELESRGLPPSLRLVIVGGERPLPERVAAWLRRTDLRRVRLFNTYGPTEATVMATAAELSPERDGEGWREVSMGRPIHGSRAYVLDRGLRPVPVGVPGELFMGGSGVARGYLGRPDATAERFLPDPFAELPGARLYRTGDRVRRRADGSLEFAGRVDDQVKVRGFRVEPGEVEAVLASHPMVVQAAVLAVEARPGEKRLVACVVPRPVEVGEGLAPSREGASPSPTGEQRGLALRAWLRERLPEFMVPAAVVVLTELPLTHQGKVDRRALLELVAAGDAADAADGDGREGFVPPRGPVEEVLAAIWAESLGRDRIGAHDGFFDLGGHSLLAIRALSRVRQAFGVELPVRVLFEEPTVAGFARRIEDALRQGGTPAPPLLPVPRDACLPLSFAQQRLWFLDRLAPGSPAYNVPLAVRLTGELDLPALAAALSEVARRHEVLRTTYAAGAGGDPVQVIAAPAALVIPRVDLRGLPPARRGAEARRLAGEEARRPFDLQRGPVWRPALLRLDEREHLLSATMHHIATDAWSMDVLQREVAALYGAARQGLPSPLPPLPVQYADFAVWQRLWLRGEVLEGHLAYWRERLGDGPPPLDLPLDRPRSTAPAAPSPRAGRRTVDWPEGSWPRLAGAGRGLGATPFMTVLAGYQTLLRRITGETDVAVGVPVANRDRGEVEGLIGFFLNTLVLRSDLAGDPSFRDLLARVREATLGAYVHQDLPFERLVEELRPQHAGRRDGWRNPLFDVALAFQTVLPGVPGVPGLELAQQEAETGVAKFDLGLEMTEAGDFMAAQWEYAAELFDASTIDRLSLSLWALLEAAVMDPGTRLSDLPLLAAAQRHQLLLDWNDTEGSDERELTVHELFERQVERRPDAVAVVDGDEQLTYLGLAAAARRLARHLQALGIGAGEIVGLPAGRSVALPAAMLGILQAGGAYLPLAPDAPQERLSQILEDAGVRIVVPESGFDGGAPLPGRGSGEAGEGTGVRAHADDLVYVMYTSGSTGRPKGVAVPHRGVVRLVRPMEVGGHARLGPSEVLLQVAPGSFDASTFEIWGALLNGGRLVMMPPGAPALDAIADALARHGITTLHLTAGLFHVMVDERLEALAERTELRQLLTGGDVLSASHVRRAAEGLPGCTVIACYGPTEGTTFTSCHFVRASADGGPDAGVPLGRPIGGTRIHVVDRLAGESVVVPLGVAGELVVGGDGLARGYLGRPDLTAERFVPDPWSAVPGERLYRTGDQVRRRADGTLEFLGRLDQQVKVRGFRVELEEIEAVLGAHPEVARAAVLAVGEGRGEKRLVAYVVASGPAPDLRAWLQQRLPEYMVPAAVVVLPALPLTRHGKVDRRALAALAPEGAGGERARVPPRTPVEETLAAIWSDVLGVGPVGTTDDFFALGGHSLLATQVVARVRQAFGVDVPLRALFEGPTLEELVRTVEAAWGAEGPEAPPIVPVARTADLPLSFAQQRLWFLDRLVPDNPFYNIFSGVRLAGPMDVAALRAACREIARRHEVLRTTFPSMAGRPVQAIAAEPPGVLPLIDLAALPAPARGRELERLAMNEGRRPFDLVRGPVFRTALLRLGAAEHSLFFNIHHIAADGWSMGVLYRELAALYGAGVRLQRSPLPELPVQYADFAVWQRDWLQGEALRVRLDYWRRQLAGMPEILELPFDHPRPAVESFRGEVEVFTLGAPLAQGLSGLARRHGATLPMVVLAGFKALLARLSSRRDVPVGVAIANRNRRETEDLIGFFVNTLVLRTDTTAANFGDLVGRVRETALGAYAHQDLPFERLVEELAPERDLGRNPLVQVTFGFHNLPRREVETAGLVLAVPEREGIHTGTAKFDLSFHVTEVGGALQGVLEYNLDLFDPPTARRQAGWLATLLTVAVERPAAPLALLPLFSAAERHQLLLGWNDTKGAYERELTVHELFELQVAQRPDAVAVVDGEEQLTYLGLAEVARRLARHLQASGIGEEEIVGLPAERSARLPAAMLGILQAGGAYLPLDPEAPPERIDLMLREAGVRIVVGGGAPLPGRGPGEAGEGTRVRADGLAYVMYTSGSTGRPKGVAVPHRGIVRLVRRAGYARLDETETLLQVAPASFDASTFEIWGALLNGGRLVMMPPEKPTLDGIGDALARHGVTTLHLTAGLFHAMVEERLGRLAGLRQLLTGGDVVSAPHVRWAVEGLPGCAVFACYGPTEGTTFTSVHPVGRDGAGVETSVPIGRPISNTRIHVLDSWLTPVPLGVAGDLAVAGDGLARGYFGRPDLTAERFRPDPLGRRGERLYLTGDRVRHLADGTLEFLGRFDTQVKVRGFRVEPAEIEAHLAEHPAVRASAVIAHQEGEWDRRLVAYVVPDRGHAAGGDVTQVESWTRIFDDTYRETAADPTFDTVGWVSTTTGLPLSREEMTEWVEDAVDRILSLSPRRVLEIGCGTGLLLFRIAPHCERYIGTDISPRVLADVGAHLGELRSRVRLLERPADRFDGIVSDGIAAGSVDLVILNSVVQYFPGADYLVTVLERAVEVVRPGGAIFLGDVRSLPLLDAFHAAVELAGAAPAVPPVPISRLRRRAESRRLQENELAVDPVLFAELARRLPEIARVEVHPKRGRAHNELTAFRYQVVLRLGELPAAPAPAAVPWLDWRAEGLVLDILRSLLEDPTARLLGVCGVPNARSAAHGRAAALLFGQQDAGDAAGLLREAAEAARGAVDPQDLWDLAAELGWEVDLGWADPGPEGRFEAVFRRAAPGDAPLALLLPPPPAPLPPGSHPWSAWTTDPLRGQLARRLAPELRAFLAGRLPDYMLPAAVVPLASLPLTPNGKVDRAALARLGLAADLAERATGLGPPRTPTEERLAAIWSDLLKVPRVGAGDDFFALGGHSLLATQAISRVRDAFGVELPLRALFETPTVAGLAAGIERAAGHLARQEAEREPVPPLVPVARDRPLPLSFAQQRLWFLDRLVPDNPFYNIFAAVRLAGPVDVAALRAACVAIARRHEVLRTTFSAATAGSQPFQVIAPPSAVDPATTLPLIDLGGLPAAARRAELERVALAEGRRPFDLQSGPVFRTALLRLDAGEHSLFFNVHHIAADGWSTGILHRDLAALYAGFAGRRPAAALPELPVQYADFAVWQRGWLQGEALRVRLDYWRRQLAGMPEVLELPYDHPRPAVESFRGGLEAFTWEAPLVGRLSALAGRQGATLSMVVLAGFKALLARLAERDDVAVGAAIANRTRREIEDLIGFFVNTLVLRTETASASFAGLVARVRETSLGAYAHQDVPFEKLVEELAPERDLGRNPLIQVMFGFHNLPRREVEAAGLVLAPGGEEAVDTGTSKFDLTLHLFEADGAVRGLLEYSADLFDAVTARRLTVLLETLLAAAAAEPGTPPALLPLLGEAERHQLAREWNDAAAAYPAEAGLAELFGRRACLAPDATAVLWDGQTLTYVGLAHLAHRLAGRLGALGLPPEARVGLCLDRSPELIVGMLGIVQAGAAYVPLDPAYPDERLAFLVKDAGLAAIVAEERTAEVLKEALSPSGTDLPILQVSPSPGEGDGEERERGPGGEGLSGSGEGLAYVIYTSGSTGVPKGVEVPQRAVARLVLGTDYVQLCPADRVAQVANASFDAITFEVWGALLTGGAIVGIDKETALWPDRFAAALRESGVSAMFVTTALFNQTVRARPDAFASLRALLFGGEAVDPQRVREAVAAGPPERLLHVYGPTESTTFATWHPVESVPAGAVSVPIGRPIANTSAYVLDPLLQPVPAGVPGELCLGGDGLARGYAGRAALTAETFVPDPFGGNGSRLYRTGDRVRLRHDGAVEFLGRFDGQVKVRGFRVEPGEIEARLAEHPAVRASAVLVHEEGPDDRRLVAYVVPGSPDAAAGHEVPAGHVAEWSQVFDDIYRVPGPYPEATFNTVGWIDSSTGDALSRQEMEEWLEDTVGRILGLAPGRVLEIGCGTGLLLFRLAPHCEQYTGTDISSRVLAYVDEHLGEVPVERSRVRLLERPADCFDGIADGSVDTVILNSVVQYFPDAAYLAAVLERAVAAVRPGGAIFLGDLRSLPLLTAFYVFVDLALAQPRWPVSWLLRRAEAHRLQEHELVLDPAFFGELARRLPGIARVEIHPKRGRGHNELTAFRYQVVLRVGEAPPGPGAADVPWLDWQGEGLTVETLRRRLETGTGLLGIRNVPNARAAFHGAVASLLLRQEERARDVAGLIRQAGEVAGGGVEPQDLWDLGRRLGWEVELGWSDPGPLGCFEAVFRRPDPSGAADGPVSLLLPQPEPPAEPRPWNAYASDPARGQFARRMAPELRAFLASRLPGYMVPSTIVPLDALPLTPNGKVDRRALAQLGPAADLARAEGERFAAPRSATEQRLAAIWADLLKVPRVGAEDDFFHLGGHSLLATQAVSRVREAFGVELPLRALFESPTVAGLAAVIDEAGEERGPAPPPMVPVPRDRPLPPSFAQERLWFLDRFGVRPGAYNEAAAFRLAGRLDVAAFRWALDEIVRRHEALRTTFGEIDGRPVQRIAPTCLFDLPLVDLAGTGPSLGEVQRLATQLARHPFDLARGPLFRGLLLRLADADHAVLFAFHHVVFDGWSIGIFLRELGALYSARLAGKPSSLPPLPLQYADFAVWQRRWLQGEVLERQMAYWRRALADLPPLGLPTDHPRPAVPGSRGGAVAVSLGRELSWAVRDLGRRRGATPFMVLLAAFQALLQRYTGEDDVAVGTPIANRNRGEIEGLIGFFVNVLVLRGELSGDPGFRALVDRAREVALGAFAHQDLPFEKVVEELQPERDLGRNPLFQVGFQVMNVPASSLEMPELALAPASSAEPAAKFDLSLTLTDGAEIAGALDYDAVLFERATAWRIARHFQTLVAGAVADPSRRLSELPLLAPAEEHQLLTEWNDTREGAPESILERLRAWAERSPDATALVFAGEEHLGYGELVRRVGRLAGSLAALGVGPESLVGLALGASIEAVVALLAVWRAGGAYLPLDPSYPADRLAFMREDSGVSLVLNEERLEALLDGGRPHLDPPPVPTLPLPEGGRPHPRGSGSTSMEPSFLPVSPSPGEGEREERERGPGGEGLAYLIYTSGSTGLPKGVAVPRRGLANLARFHAHTVGLGPGDRVLLFASFSFDASVADLVAALGTGATLVLARRESLQPGPDLAGLLAREQVTFGVLVPSVLAAVPWSDLPALSRLATAGEAVTAELVERWAPGRRFWNLYGPTEITVFCAGGELHPAGRAPDFGRSIRNSRAIVVDLHLRPSPVGVPGELLLQSPGLARGYHRRPDLTAERFVPDPWAGNEPGSEPGGRLYRSGDLVRRLADGRLEFLGRLDRQVKVRGIRIEPGEVEAALVRHPAVERAAVAVRGYRLVAFVVPRQRESSDALLLRDDLRRRLPEPMVPEAVVFVDQLPLDPNGKVDRRALERIAVEGESPAGGFVPPRTPVEQVLAGIWAAVLGIERVGAGDDFFALSGNSMLAAQVAWRVRQALGVELPLRRLFERATLAELAREIEERSGWAMPPLPPLSPIARLQNDRPQLASFYQEFGWRLQGGLVGALLNMPLALRARGPLDLGTLQAVLAEIVRRHELLRSVFLEIDGALYVEARPAGGVPMPVIDLSALPEPRREELALHLACEDAARPFDLSRAPGFRAQIVRLGEQDHALLSNLHHMISDGTSLVIYRRELWTLYDAFLRGEPSPLAELPIQPTDVAGWQRRIEADFIAPQLAWWRERLAGRPPAQVLPGDRPRPAVVGPEALSDLLVLPVELAHGLRSLARSTGCTLSMVLTAAVQALLHRYTGEEDITVGGVFAGRDRPELNGLIGLFLNTLPLRADLAESPTFRALLHQVRDVVLEAHAHQGVPFPLLLRELLPGQAPDRRLLFKVVLNVLDFGFAGPPPAVEGDAKGLSVQPFAGMQEWARYDLALDVDSVENLLICRFLAAADILTREGLVHLQADFQALLEQIVADPGTPISRLLPEPRHQPLPSP